MEDVLHFIFGILGNIFGAALFLAPAITFYYVIRRGSTEEFSGIPYVVCLLNCLLYAWYGLPFVSSNNILVTVSDGSGAVLELIYVCLYLAYSPPRNKRKIMIFLVVELALFGVIAVVSMAALHDTARTYLVGIVAAVLSICMYGAPLSIMKLVVETKSVEYMPFFLSLFVFLCSLSWFVYGILGRDPFVGVGSISSQIVAIYSCGFKGVNNYVLKQVPNGVGAVLGVAQLVLYWIYKDSTPTKSVDFSVDPERLIQ